MQEKRVQGKIKDPRGRLRASKLTMKLTQDDRKAFYELARQHADTGADFVVLLIGEKEAVSKALNARKVLAQS